MSEAVKTRDDDAPTKREVVTLGGKRFVVINFERRTVLIDHYLAKLIRKSGIDKVVPMDSDGEGEAAHRAYVVRLQTALLDSGVAHEVIAGFLLPEGKVERDWTPAMGRETAAHIGALDTQDDREAVLRLAMEAVFGFFLSGIRRLASISDSLHKQTTNAGSPSGNGDARAH